MSKADEKSKQYRDFREECGIKDPVMLDEIEEAYYEGYLQAEKDLELTWEDIRELYIIFAEVDVEIELCKANNITAETIGYYQEVLKRFKDFKKGKMEAKDSTCASEDLYKATKEWLIPQLDRSYEPYGERKMMELTRFDGYSMLEAVEFGANWMLNKITKQDKNKED